MSLCQKKRLLYHKISPVKPFTSSEAGKIRKSAECQPGSDWRGVCIKLEKLHMNPSQTTLRYEENMKEAMTMNVNISCGHEEHYSVSWASVTYR